MTAAAAQELTLYPPSRPHLDVRHVRVSAILGDPLGPEPTPTFLESIEHFGVLQPILVKSIGEDLYALVAGSRRLKAARKLELESIPVAIVVLNGWNDHEVIALAENTLRSRNLASQLEAIERLRERGHSDTEIARASGMSKRELLGRMVPLLQLHPKLREALDQGEMAPGTAMKAAKLPGGYQEKLVERLEAGAKLTGQDVREVREVQSEDAVATLPAALFDEAAVEPTTRPQKPVEIDASADSVSLLRAALKRVQGDSMDANVARNHIQRAIDYLTGHGDDIPPKKKRSRKPAPQATEPEVTAPADVPPGVDPADMEWLEAGTRDPEPVAEVAAPTAIEGMCATCEGAMQVIMQMPDGSEQVTRCPDCDGTGVAV